MLHLDLNEMYIYRYSINFFIVIRWCLWAARTLC